MRSAWNTSVAGWCRRRGRRMPSRAASSACTVSIGRLARSARETGAPGGRSAPAVPLRRRASPRRGRARPARRPGRASRGSPRRDRRDPSWRRRCARPAAARAAQAPRRPSPAGERSPSNSAQQARVLRVVLLRVRDRGLVARAGPDLDPVGESREHDLAREPRAAAQRGRNQDPALAIYTARCRVADDEPLERFGRVVQHLFGEAVAQALEDLCREEAETLLPGREPGGLAAAGQGLAKLLRKAGAPLFIANGLVGPPEHRLHRLPRAPMGRGPQRLGAPPLNSTWSLWGPIPLSGIVSPPNPTSQPRNARNVREKSCTWRHRIRGFCAHWI